MRSPLGGSQVNATAFACPSRVCATLASIRTPYSPTSIVQAGVPSGTAGATICATARGAAAPKAAECAGLAGVAAGARRVVLAQLDQVAGRVAQFDAGAAARARNQDGDWLAAAAWPASAPRPAHNRR